MEAHLRTSLIKEEPYRIKQIYDWVFRRQVSSFEAMSNLPATLRKSLEENYLLRSLKIVKKECAKDGTTKFTFETRDRKNFTAVFLPHVGYSTACISSQVGCAWKCQFCASGLVDFDRNLSAGEILDQIFLIERDLKIKIKNVLFMGMGEPLANYSNLVSAVRWLVSPLGLQWSPAHVTLSTTGVAPQIKKIALERLNINLALSLHSADEAIRKKIMPVSSKFSVREVLEACKIFQAENDSDLTIEYILLDGVNDGIKEAEKLAAVLNSIRFKRQPKINLIPYNPVPDLPYKTSRKDRMEAFFQFLKSKNFIAHTRKPQGQDIGAACGQLG